MDPLDFLGPLYETAPRGSGVVELRALKNAGGFHDRLFTDEPGLIRLWASRYRVTAPAAAYYGVALRMPGSTTGKKSDIAAVTALWADVDVVKNGWDMTSVLGSLKSHELRPSAIVNSGNGYHLYWVLDEPIEIDGNPHVAKMAEETMRALAEVFGGDNTVDVTRVLRLPGTWNTKDLSRPKEVKVVLADWREWTIRDLDVAAHESPTVLSAGGWADKNETRKRMREEAKKAGLTGAMTDATGLRVRRLTWNQIWDHAKYGGAPIGSAFFGTDEAILRATALLFSTTVMTDREIADAIVARLKTKIPAQMWDEHNERKKIQDKLERYKPKWLELQAERKKDRARKGSEVSDNKRRTKGPQGEPPNAA